MPQLDLTRLFLDNITWFLGFIMIFILFILCLYITPLKEKFWFFKFKSNFKKSFRVYIKK